MALKAVDTFDVEIQDIISGSNKKVGRDAIVHARKFLANYTDLPEGEVKRIIKKALNDSMDSFCSFDDSEDEKGRSKIDHKGFGKKVILSCVEGGISLRRVPKDVEKAVEDEFAGTGKRANKKMIENMWGVVSSQSDLSHDEKFDAFTEAVTESMEFSSLKGDGKFSPRLFGMAVAKKIEQRRKEREFEEVTEDNDTINYDGNTQDLSDTTVFFDGPYNAGQHFDDLDGDDFDDLDDDDGYDGVDLYNGDGDMYDNAKGKRKAARQARRADRKEARQTKKAERKSTRKATRQDRKQGRIDARQTRKATRKQGRIDRRTSRVQGRMDKKMLKTQARADRKAVRKGLTPAGQAEAGMNEQMQQSVPMDQGASIASQALSVSTPTPQPMEMPQASGGDFGSGGGGAPSGGGGGGGGDTSYSDDESGYQEEDWGGEEEEWSDEGEGEEENLSEEGEEPSAEQIEDAVEEGVDSFIDMKDPKTKWIVIGGAVLVVIVALYFIRKK